MLYDASCIQLLPDAGSALQNIACDKTVPCKSALTKLEVRKLFENFALISFLIGFKNGSYLWVSLIVL